MSGKAPEQLHGKKTGHPDCLKSVLPADAAQMTAIYNDHS
jgi:hypothetical protein